MKYSILIVAILLLGACKKKDQPKYIYYINNPTDYVLTKVVYTMDTSLTEVYDFTYNEGWMLTGVVRNILLRDGTDVYTAAKLRYNGSRCEHIDYTGIDDDMTLDYSYNDDTLPVSSVTGRLHHSTYAEYSYSNARYVYDANHNCTLCLDTTMWWQEKFINTYGQDNNLRVSEHYYPNPQTYGLPAKTVWTSFDDKINFARTINGTPGQMPWDGNLQIFSISSPNNPLSTTTYSGGSPGTPYTDSTVTNYTYQYNSVGLPVLLTYGMYTVTFTYQKFR